MRGASVRSGDYAERLEPIPACQKVFDVVLGINASSALRMDLTGARWGLDGAEAVLKLRALGSNGDFEDYWRYHLAQEKQRNHEANYTNGLIPQAA